jgi:hypothetical protein
MDGFDLFEEFVDVCRKALEFDTVDSATVMAVVATDAVGVVRV